MFIHRIKLENILSFGPDAQELELKPLNVLIGPNGSGKSNLIEVIGLLGAAPSDVTAPMREGGGGKNWIWRGEPKATEACVEVVLRELLFGAEEQLFRYCLGFGRAFFGAPYIREEFEEVKRIKQDEDEIERYLQRSADKVVLSYIDDSGVRNQRELRASEIESDQSILSQIKDPFQYSELTSLGFWLAGIQLYRQWSFGRNAPSRSPQKADLPNHSLAEDGTNLGMVLNRLDGDPKAKTRFLTALRKLYHGIDDYYVQIEAGSVQVFLKEGNLPIPAVRLSDGTLRYLCLLAILCNPNLPALICLEEPELGLHPDILPRPRGLAARSLRTMPANCHHALGHPRGRIDGLT